MSVIRRLKLLWPPARRAEEREMQDELNALESIAGRRELGNLTLAAENTRAVWGWPWLEGIARDFRYAFRTLARRPSFAVMAILSLGLGIGANSAIYSLMDALLWRQLPVHEPDQLVSFPYSMSYFAFQQFQAKSGDVLSGVIATAGTETRDLDTGSGPLRGRVEMVTGNYFEVLGVTAALGRTITPDDDRRGRPSAVVVLSYPYWQRAYGGDPSALGRTIRVGKVPFTIAGVAPPEFFGVTVGEAADVWAPLSLLAQVFPGNDWLDLRNTNFLSQFGRLRPGMTRQRAEAALQSLSVAVELERNGPDL
ncbi:MAG TPA: ABC transporter permease [Bryobacteraceae bacterium]